MPASNSVEDFGSFSSNAVNSNSINLVGNSGSAGGRTNSPDSYGNPSAAVLGSSSSAAANDGAEDDFFIQSTLQQLQEVGGHHVIPLSKFNQRLLCVNMKHTFIVHAYKKALLIDTLIFQKYGN